jgi:hypothetical protein
MQDLETFRTNYPVESFSRGGTYGHMAETEQYVIKKGSLSAMLPEIDLLSQFRHPCLIKMLNWTSYTCSEEDLSSEITHLTETSTIIEMALPKGARIYSYTRENQDKIQYLASKLAEVLVQFCCHGLIHRDIKPDNIVVIDGNPVLIDFGLSSLTYQGKYKGLAYTDFFRCPSQDDTKWNSYLTEVFALGRTLTVLALRYTPEEGEPISLTSIEPNLRDFIQRCTKPLDERLTWADVLQDSYINQYDYTKMIRVTPTSRERSLPKAITERSYGIIAEYLFELGSLYGMPLRTLITVFNNMWRTWYLFDEGKYTLGTAQLFAMTHFLLADHGLLGQNRIDIKDMVWCSDRTFTRQQMEQSIIVLLKALDGIITPRNTWDETITTKEEPLWREIIWIVQKETCLYQPEPLIKDEAADKRVFSGINVETFWRQFQRIKGKPKDFHIEWFIRPMQIKIPYIQ